MGTYRYTTRPDTRSPTWQGALGVVGGTGDEVVDHGLASSRLHHFPHWILMGAVQQIFNSKTSNSPEQFSAGITRSFLSDH